MTHRNDDGGFGEANEHVMRELVEEMLAFANFLRMEEVAEDRVWFRDLLVGILRGGHENYRSIKACIAEWPTQAAWGASNLIELRSVCSYVLASRENAEGFLTDFPADRSDFVRAITKNDELKTKWMAALLRTTGLDSKEEFTGVIEKAAEIERRELESSPPGRASGPDAIAVEESGVELGSRSVHRLAIARLRESGALGARYRIYSHFIHSTAFSILAPTQEDVCAPLISVISADADTNVSIIFASVKDHFESHGVDWPS
jgi:hypothetical protein